MNKDKAKMYLNRYKEISQNQTDQLCNIEINDFVTEIKSENYDINKLFVDSICAFLENELMIGCWNQINQTVFNEIVMPVFITEYKKDNAKYIKWIGQCREFILKSNKEEFFDLIDAPEIFKADTFKYCEYFLIKSFMLDKNQHSLDILMNYEVMDILIYRLELPNWSALGNYEKYLEVLKPFAEKLERFKEYCRISGNDKWNKLLAIWESLVTHMYKYEKEIRHNSSIGLNDYLNEKDITSDLLKYY